MTDTSSTPQERTTTPFAPLKSDTATSIEDVAPASRLLKCPSCGLLARAIGRIVCDVCYGRIVMEDSPVMSLIMLDYQKKAAILDGDAIRLKHDLLEGLSAAQRKEYPVKTGFLDYFRDAMYRVAHVSYVGNEQHNPGQPLHWARGKSTDHLDCLIRHIMCSDLEEHLAAAAWRALADLQEYLEKTYHISPPPGARIG
jgi:hypothetical protein